MGNLVSHLDSTTSREVRKTLRRTRMYRNLHLRVSRRLGVGKPTVSKAASGKFPGRYKRVEIALLQEMTRFEPQVAGLVAELIRGKTR